jgi:hypothetical protein
VEREEKDERERSHESVDKVAVSKEKVLLEPSEMIHEHELVEEDLEEPLRGDLVGGVDRAF